MAYEQAEEIREPGLATAVIPLPGTDEPMRRAKALLAEDARRRQN